MYLNKKNAQIVKDALETWRDDGDISDREYYRLLDTIDEEVTSSLGLFAKWFTIFIAAAFIISTVRLFSSFEIFGGNSGRFDISVILSIIFYFIGFKIIDPEKVLLKNAFILIGVFFTSWAIAELGIMVSKGNQDPTPPFLLGSIVFILIGSIGRSQIVWLFALISLGLWFVSQVGYFRGEYYFGF